MGEKTIKIGDKIPSFSAKDQYGNPFKLDTLVGEKGIVLYFYPKDFTPGCTKEACQFARDYAMFKALGVEVIGVSSDRVCAHHRFTKKYDLPFVLLSDPKQKIRHLLGIKKHGLGFIPGRETLLIDKNGILQWRYRQLKASEHAAKTLKKAKVLFYED